MAGARAAALAAVLGYSGAGVALPGATPAAPDVIARSAYQHAAATASCAPLIQAADLAAIRSIESPGSIGTELADGIVPGVAGPALDGSGVGGNTEAILTAAGAPDRALGPMQFIASSWELFGRDGNGDGQVDVNNLWDSTAAAAAHLCASRTAGATRWEAFRDYNGSGPAAARYADTALARATGELADQTGPTTAAAPTSAPAPAFECEVATAPSGAPDIVDTAHCAAQRTWEQLLAGWDATGRLIARDGNVQPVAGLYAALDQQLTIITGGARPGPASATTLRTAQPAPTSPRADGLDPRFGARLDQLLADAPAPISIRSGRRTPLEQKDLHDRYLAGTGNLAAWSDGVTCHSDHCAGLAADLIFPDTTTEQWAHDHADQYGLVFDVEGEAWHVSLADNERTS